MLRGARHVEFDVGELAGLGNRPIQKCDGSTRAHCCGPKYHVLDANVEVDGGTRCSRILGEDQGATTESRSGQKLGSVIWIPNHPCVQVELDSRFHQILSLREVYDGRCSGSAKGMAVAVPRLACG